VKVRFEQYDDEVYYEPINSESNGPVDEGFVDLFEKLFQSDKIKLDISVGLGVKFLDILNI
jgi:hypothetical protein